MSDTEGRTSRDSEGRLLIEPEKADDDTMRLFGVGPECPGCGGPTHCVTADPDAEKPWWCQECNVRFDPMGVPGSQADFPSGSEPNVEQ